MALTCSTSSFANAVSNGLWEGKIVISEVDEEQILFRFCTDSTLYFHGEILCPGVSIKDYKGMTASLKSKRIEGSHKIYIFEFSNGKELLYNDYASNPDDHARDLKDLVKGMSYVSLLQDVKRLNKTKGNLVFPNENLFYSGVDFSGSKVKIKLSNGKSYYEKDLNRKIRFIDLFIQKNKIEALAILDDVNVSYDDMEDKWTHHPYKVHPPVYPYFSLSTESGMSFYMHAFYKGKNWVFFDEIIIKTHQDIYRKKNLEPRRAASRGGVVENTLIEMTSREWSVLSSLVESGGKIRFSGESNRTKNLTEKQREYLSKIMRLIELME